MPNHCSNWIWITAKNSEQQDKIIDLLGSSSSVLDFNRLIPIPEEFKDISTGGQTIDGKQVDLWRTVHSCDYNEKIRIYQCEVLNRTDKGLELDKNKFQCKDVIIPDDELKELQQKYGHVGSYNWCWENWGTKWNAYTVKRDIILNSHNVSDQNKGIWINYEFTTAWEPPRPIYDFIQQIIEERWNDVGFYAKAWLEEDDEPIYRDEISHEFFHNVEKKKFEQNRQNFGKGGEYFGR
jgi:hypothetical protein